MYDAMLAETVTVFGDGGEEIEAYLARPMREGPLGGVVVIHHMPGYDEPTKEIARTFAVHGYNALMPNLYHRDAPGASPDDAAAAARAKGGVPDDRLVGDVAGTDWRPPEQYPITPTLPFDEDSPRRWAAAPATSPSRRSSGTPPLARAAAAASSGLAPGASRWYRFGMSAL